MTVSPRRWQPLPGTPIRPSSGRLAGERTRYHLRTVLGSRGLVLLPRVCGGQGRRLLAQKLGLLEPPHFHPFHKAATP